MEEGFLIPSQRNLLRHPGASQETLVIESTAIKVQGVGRQYIGPESVRRSIVEPGFLLRRLEENKTVPPISTHYPTFPNDSAIARITYLVYACRNVPLHPSILLTTS